MKRPLPLVVVAGVVATCISAAQGAPLFGAYASGSELDTPGIVRDGGAGSSGASISRPNFSASAAFLAGSTYLPELKAYSSNTTASNSDDITQSSAAAYQVFTSSAAQTIELNISLHGIVVEDATDVSSVLADVFVYGGSAFGVSTSPICPDGRLGKFMFDGTYFCGSRLGRSNLFIDVGDVTRSEQLSIDVGAAETFGVYAILRTAASGGSADATQTLSLSFESDAFISAVSPPGSVPSPASAWLIGPGMLGLLALAHLRGRHNEQRAAQRIDDRAAPRRCFTRPNRFAKTV